MSKSRKPNGVELIGRIQTTISTHEMPAAAGNGEQDKVNGRM